MSEIKAIETEYNGYRFRSRLEARWAVFFDALGVKYEYEPEGFDLGDGLYYLPDFRVKCWGTRGDDSGEPFDLWIEVKGNMTEEDARKIYKFSGFIQRPYRSPNCPLGYKDCDLTLSPHSDYDDHERRWECSCGRAICKGNEPLPESFICTAAESSEKICVYDYKLPQNKILVVGNIPPHGHSSDSSAVGAYDCPKIGPYPFNYELIDGDYFAAYPAAYNGKFFLWGDDSNYIWNEAEVEAAYDVARQARFEHGEKPFSK